MHDRIGWIFKITLPTRAGKMKNSEKISWKKKKVNDNQYMVKISKTRSIEFRTFRIEMSLENSNFITTTGISQLPYNQIDSSFQYVPIGQD